MLKTHTLKLTDAELKEINEKREEEKRIEQEKQREKLRKLAEEKAKELRDSNAIGETFGKFLGELNALVIPQNEDWEKNENMVLGVDGKPSEILKGIQIKEIEYRLDWEKKQKKHKITRAYFDLEGKLAETSVKFSIGKNTGGRYSWKPSMDWSYIKIHEDWNADRKDRYFKNYKLAAKRIVEFLQKQYEDQEWKIKTKCNYQDRADVLKELFGEGKVSTESRYEWGKYRKFTKASFDLNLEREKYADSDGSAMEEVKVASVNHNGSVASDDDSNRNPKFLSVLGNPIKFRTGDAKVAKNFLDDYKALVLKYTDLVEPKEEK